MRLPICFASSQIARPKLLITCPRLGDSADLWQDIGGIRGGHRCRDDHFGGGISGDELEAFI